jgi:hypothetical protein
MRSWLGLCRTVSSSNINTGLLLQLLPAKTALIWMLSAEHLWTRHVQGSQ